MSGSICSRCHSPMAGSEADGYCPRCAGRLLLDTAPADEGAGELRPAPTSSRLGEYVLGAELGRGAMGVVYRARQPRLKRDVALKVILASRFAGETARKRFLAEAELAAQLDHPNIVPIYEVGETPDGPFYAMKLVEGGTLAQKVSSFGFRVPGSETAEGHRNQLETSNSKPETVAALLAKIARAVHHAHQRGVLHRDLKPGNILLDARGEPHITDFGLARQMGAESSLTVTGSSLGTPAYMSPEQARGDKTITTASDVWSLGAILYHLLAGRPPFEGATAVEVMRKVMESEPGRLGMAFGVWGLGNRYPPDPSAQTSKPIPSDLSVICLKCLEKDPSRRYTSARALAEDLERWLNHEPILARPSTPGERFVKWTRRRPAIAALTVVAALLFLAGAVGVTWQWRRAEKNAAAERASSEKVREQLWHARLGQARAGRLSGQFGRKRAGLEAIAAAAAIRPASELRDEAIAHLALFDLQTDPRPRPLPDGFSLPVFDARLEHYAVLEKDASAVHVRRVSDDAELFRWPVPRGAVDLGISPQGRYFFFSSEGRFLVFETQTGQERFRLHDCERARISPDDQTLVVIDRNLRVRFHDTANGELHPQELAVRNFGNNWLYWSPDSRFITLLDGNKLEVWDWRLKESVATLASEWKLSGSIGWEGDWLAFGDDEGGIRLWNSRTGKVRLLPGHEDAIYDLLLPAGGKVLASISPDGTSRFWNTATGKLLLTTDRGFAMHFSRDGARVAYRTPSEWGVWQVDAPRAFRLVSVGDQRSTLVSTADLSPDNRSLLLASSGSSLRLYDLETEQSIRLPLRDARVAWFMPDGKNILTSGRAQGLALRPLNITTNDANELAADVGPAETVPGVEWKDSDSAGFSDDGTRAGTRVSSREVVIVNLRDTNRVLRLTGVRHACRPTFSADGRWVVTASENGGGPCLWDGNTGAFVRQLHQHHYDGGVQFSPDGLRLVTSDPSGVRFYDTATWKVICHLPVALATPLAGSVAFTPDSRLVAFTLGKRELRLANPRTGEVLATLISPEPRPINSLRFSRDGRHLAVATGTDAVDLWDIARIEDELKKLGLDLQP